MKKILSFILPLFLGFSSFGQSTFINEINYLSPVQCLEIVTPAGSDLSSWEIGWYESDGSVSASQNVSGPVNSTIVGFDIVIVDAIIFMHGNGGVALIDDNGNVVEFLSFGTVITATNGPAIGLSSSDIGVQTVLNNSLQLIGEGSVSTDFMWTTDNLSSCGLPNVEQTLTLAGKATSLPIELLYFKADERGKKIYLEWETLSELNNSHFLLEKSKDGRNWSSLEEIPGKLNSNQPITYEHLDHSPYSGTNYYRLSQFDIDGKMEVFDIIVLQIGANNDLKIFPNPASDVIYIKLPNLNNYDDVKVVVYNMFGKLVTVDALSNDVLHVSHLEPGIYSIQIINGNQQYQMLFTKM